jgi:hypothetical protein
MSLTLGRCITGRGVLAHRPTGSAACNRYRAIPQEFTALVLALFFKLKAYGVSSLAGREPKMEILACLEQRGRDAILVGQPESNIPPRDRGRLPLVA